MSPRAALTHGVAAALLLLAAAAPQFAAQTCTVPGSHATLQQAVDDAGCATVTLVTQTYAESVVIRRSLTVAGPDPGVAVVQGLVLASGAGIAVTLNDIRVENGCSPDAVRAIDGAAITGNGLEVERSAALPCPDFAPLFIDGFESGNTNAWSSVVP